MSRPVWVNNQIKIAFRFIPYIVGLSRTSIANTFSRLFLFSKQDDMYILPVDSTVKINIPVDSANTALPSQITEYFINQAEYFFIMDTCLCRDSLKCKDYPRDLGCLFLGEASTRINPGVGREVTREEAFAHIKRAKEAGLVQMIGRTLPDALWLNVKPHAKLFTICLCCPCCCVTRMVPYSNETLRSVVHPLPGIKIKVSDRCTGCGLCAKSCYVRAISMTDDRAVIGERCMGCGRCAEKCPDSAIDVLIERKDYFREAVDNLVKRVDLK